MAQAAVATSASTPARTTVATETAEGLPKQPHSAFVSVVRSQACATAKTANSAAARLRGHELGYPGRLEPHSAVPRASSAAGNATAVGPCSRDGIGHVATESLKDLKLPNFAKPDRISIVPSTSVKPSLKDTGSHTFMGRRCRLTSRDCASGIRGRQPPFHSRRPRSGNGPGTSADRGWISR